MAHETLRVLTSSTDVVQVLTTPIKIMGSYVEHEAVLWAEGLLAQARTCSNDAARFVQGL